MKTRKIIEQFELLAGKMKQVASEIQDHDYVEASFMLGCLYEICVYNALKLERENE